LQGFILNTVTALFFGFVLKSRPHPFFILFYALVLALFFCLYGYFKKRGCDLRVLKISMVLTVGLGIFGSCIFILFTLYYPWRLKHSKPFMEWYESIFPPEIREEESVVYERIITEKEDYSNKFSLVPFREIMSHGSESQKSEAITKMLKFFDPRFSGALVMGLSDPDPVIRVRSATAVASLEDKYLLEIAEHERTLQENPKDKDALLDLARVLESYTHCEFVNAETREQDRLKAIDLCKRYLNLNPEDESMRLRLARLYFEQKMYMEAENIYIDLIALDGISNIGLLKGYLEVLFAQQNFEMVRTVCRSDYYFLDRMTEEALRLKETLHLWRFEDEAAHGS
jgi:tetratricopeptide (TPR) repeat protein